MRTPRTAALVAAALVPVALAVTPPAFPPWGVTLAYIDTTVTPGTDFFRHTNGAWLKGAVIPPDRQVAGINLELDKGNETKLKGIVAQLRSAPDTKLSTEERKLRDLYDAFEDTAAIEAAGLAPVEADLERIAALKSHEDVAAFMGSPATQVGGPFAIDIDIDEKNPRRLRGAAVAVGSRHAGPRLLPSRGQGQRRDACRVP